MNKAINIKEDCVIIFEKPVKLPIKLNSLIEILGEGNIKELSNGKKIYVWEQNGIYVWIDGEIVTGFRININIDGFELCNTNFKGSILINNEDYNNLKWKNDEYNIEKEYKNGAFSLFLEENSEFLTIPYVYLPYISVCFPLTTNYLSKFICNRKVSSQYAPW